MNVYMDYRPHLQGYPRGETADFFPTRPTPFTASLFREGWAQARRMLALALNGNLPSPWRWHEGQFHVVPEFWTAVVQRLEIPAFTVAHLLALPGFPREIQVRRRRGFWARLRKTRKSAINARRDEIEQLDHEVRRWYRHVRAMTWVQAEILQVMEEVAVYVGKVLYGYTWATLALLDTFAQASDPSEWLREIYSRAHGLPSMPPISPPTGEVSLRVLGEKMPWLGFQPFEVATPRWTEENGRLNILIKLTTRTNGEQMSLFCFWLNTREQMRMNLARVVTATRHWLHAAAGEALEDGRLREADEIFLLELEEVKQMMTGEWSDPGHVQRVVAGRQRAYEEQSALFPKNDDMYWLRHPTEMPDTREVAAPGWHPGWWGQAGKAERLGTMVASPLSYGHLLAAAMNRSIRVVNHPFEQGE